MGADRTDPPERRLLGHRPDRLPRTIAVAAALGLAGGVITVAFIRTLEWLQKALFTDLPDALDVDPSAWYFLAPVVLVGAVLLGIARHHLGEYPVTIEQAIEDHKATGSFDTRHIGPAIACSLVSLGFGAALGPEAALMAILGGLGSWIAGVIKADTAEGSDIAFIGIAGALGGLFSSAGAAALALDPRTSDLEDARAGRLWRVIPGLVAAYAGVLVYRALGSSEHYFDLGLPDADLSASSLAQAVPVAAVGVGLGLGFLALGRLTDRLLAPLAGRPVLESLAGGVGLAVLASASTLILFSGHEGLITLIHDAEQDDTGRLVLLAVGKVVAAALLLSAKWKGGRFFPVMFAGGAVGLALSQAVSGVDEVTALAACMTAAVGVLTARPVVAAVFMVWFFPLAAWPIVLIGAVVGGVAGARLGDRVAGTAPAVVDPAA